jgi:hypothetical protein
VVDPVVEPWEPDPVVEPVVDPVAEPVVEPVDEPVLDPLGRRFGFCLSAGRAATDSTFGTEGGVAFT